MRNGNSHNDYDENKHDDNHAGLGGGEAVVMDWRMEALSDLLVAAGSEKTDSKALESILFTSTRLSFDDFPNEPQAEDQRAKELIAQLKSCMKEDAYLYKARDSALYNNINNNNNNNASSAKPSKKTSSTRTSSKDRAERKKSSKSSRQNKAAAVASAAAITAEESKRSDNNNYDDPHTSSALAAVYGGAMPKEPAPSKTMYNTSSRERIPEEAAPPKSSSRAAARQASSKLDRSSEVRPPPPPPAPKPQKQKREVQQQDPPSPVKSFDDADSTSYPKIGPGYSDSISVVSDLTTPTVVTHMDIDDEEHYSQLGALFLKDKTERSKEVLSERPQVPRAPSASSLQLNQMPSTIERKGGQTAAALPHINSEEANHKMPARAESLSSSLPHEVPPRPGGAAGRRQQQHAAVFGKLAVGRHPSQQYQKRSSTTQAKSMAIPENTESNQDYPSPTYFPSVFPTDDLSASIPRSTKSGARRSLLKPAGESGASGKRTMSSSQTKTSKRLGMRGIRRAKSASPRVPLSAAADGTKVPAQPPRRAASVRNLTTTPKTNATQSSTAIAPVPLAPRTSAGNSTLSRRKSQQQPMQKDGKSVDIDGVLSTMGQDIDYIFRELSELEQEDNPPPQGNANPNYIGGVEDELSVVSESNLGKTAKIKYSLGSVARSLRKNEKTSLLQQQRNEESTQNWNDTLDIGASAPSRSSVEGSSTQTSDPLLIDQDGFIISNSEDSDPFANAFGAPPPQAAATGPRAVAGKPHSQNNNKNTKDAFDSFWNQTQLGSANPSLPRPEDSNQRSKPAKPPPAAGGRTKRRSPSPYRKPSKPGAAEEGKKESRIDAVEMATKKRIEMLRKLVAERAQLPQQKANRSDAALSTKLDFVEEETMKQIARLRDRLEDSSVGR